MVLGMEARAFLMLGKHSTTELRPSQLLFFLDEESQTLMIDLPIITAHIYNLNTVEAPRRIVSSRLAWSTQGSPYLQKPK